MMSRLLPCLGLLALLHGVFAESFSDKLVNITCDIVVAGGSTASLAAALTAAKSAPELKVCFTEILDWPGGQMLSDPAIDWGPDHFDAWPENQPLLLQELMDHLQEHRETGGAAACTISTHCYSPKRLVSEFVFPQIRSLPNLQTFLRTVIVDSLRDKATGKMISIIGVQRFPKPGQQEWQRPLSQDLPDWYEPLPSNRFDKRIVQLTGSVFVEATELGDVLATAGLAYHQGVEEPSEASNASHSQCGQATTTSFFMGLGSEHSVHNGNQALVGRQQWPGMNASQWKFAWSWRRSVCGSPGNSSRCPPPGRDIPPSPAKAVTANPGDVSQQNGNNVVDNAYLFLPPDLAAAQVRASKWKGGLNFTTLQMLEQRSYDWYTFMVHASGNVDPTFPARLELNGTIAGTLHGLSKFPYLRDTRRSAMGLGGFRLQFAGVMDYDNASAPLLGYRFHDAVALSNAYVHAYMLATDSCSYPPYMSGSKGTKPFWIPLRALTVEESPNLLLAGKTMSQSAHANDATRKHPGEWTSGVAAGGVAVFMVRQSLTTGGALDRIVDVQTFLNSSAVGQPIDWQTRAAQDKPRDILI